MKIGKCYMLCIALFVGMMMSAQAAVIVSDVVDDGGDWITHVSGYWSAGDIGPQAGTDYWRAATSVNWSHRGVYNTNINVVLAEGRYTCTFNVGEPTGTTTVDVNNQDRFSVGFYDETADVAVSGALRTAIKAFRADTGVTLTIEANTQPNQGWSTFIYHYDVKAGSPLIGTTVDFGLAFNSGNTGGASMGAAFDGLLEIDFGPIPPPPPNPTSGSGTLATYSATGWKYASKEVTALSALVDGYTNGMEVSIMGSLEMQGSRTNALDDKVGFVFGGNTSATFPTGATGDTNASLLLVSTPNYVGDDEIYTFTVSGVRENNLVFSVPNNDDDNVIDYAINLTLPTNFNAGADGDGFEYAFEFGIDYDQDGTYDLVRIGTFNGFENNRIGFGMVSQHAADLAEPASSIINVYTFAVTNFHQSLVAPPTGFEGWIDPYGLTGADLDGDADPDLDGWANLYEYGLGGDPTNSAVMGTEPVISLATDGGSIEYVHVERTDDPSLDYYLELTPDLVIPAWTSMGYSVVGTNDIGAPFVEVTNAVPVDVPAKFIKLVIEQL